MSQITGIQTDSSKSIFVRRLDHPPVEGARSVARQSNYPRERAPHRDRELPSKLEARIPGKCKSLAGYREQCTQSLVIRSNLLRVWRQGGDGEVKNFGISAFRGSNHVSCDVASTEVILEVSVICWL